MDKKIQKAKQIPIETLFDGPFIYAGANKLKCLCPFHQENTPSFIIYANTNTYYCFGGCGYGDSIQFYMKLHNLKFTEAVKEMGK